MQPDFTGEVAERVAVYKAIVELADLQDEDIVVGGWVEGGVGGVGGVGVRGGAGCHGGRTCGRR